MKKKVAVTGALNPFHCQGSGFLEAVTFSKLNLKSNSGSTFEIFTYSTQNSELLSVLLYWLQAGNLIEKYRIIFQFVFVWAIYCFISINEVSHTLHLEIFSVQRWEKRQRTMTSVSHINIWYRWRSGMTPSSLGCLVYHDPNIGALMLELPQKKCNA